MADVEKTVTALSVAVTKGGTEAEPNMTVVVNYTVGGTTNKVTAPDILDDDIRRLLSCFEYSVAREKLFAILAGGEDFTITLI